VNVEHTESFNWNKVSIGFSNKIRVEFVEEWKNEICFEKCEQVNGSFAWVKSRTIEKREELGLRNCKFGSLKSRREHFCFDRKNKAPTLHKCYNDYNFHLELGQKRLVS
jgi:hypothetical protein